MKKYAFLYFLLFSLFHWSCGDDQVALFDMELEARFTLPAGLNTVETHYFKIDEVPTFVNQYLANNGISQNEVGSIVANRAVMYAEFINLDLNFIQDISIRGSKVDDPDSQREFFYMDFVDINEDQEMQLFSSISELKDVVLDSIIDMEVRINLRGFSPTSLDSRIDFTLSVFEEE